METILDPNRLAPLVKSVVHMAGSIPRVQAGFALAARFTRSVGANPFVIRTLAGASLIAARLKASPPLAGALASVAAILVFVFASPMIFRTVAPPVRLAPAPVEAPALTPPTPSADALAAAETAAREAARKAGPPPPRRPALPSIGPDAFIDRFSKLNEGRWYVADRGSNGDWSVNDFRRSQISLSQEGMNLTLAKAAPGRTTPFSSGEITSQEKFRYGYFEARLRAARGAGTDTGLFTYVRDKGPDGWNEIDIELIGGNPRQVEFAIHVGKLTAHRVIQLPFDAASGFHSYAFDWKPDSVTWYVDDRVVYVERGPAATGLTRAQNFVIDIWGSETLYRWMGKIDRNGGPYVATLSCFAYAKSYEGRALCPDPDAAPKGKDDLPATRVVSR